MQGAAAAGRRIGAGRRRVPVLAGFGAAVVAAMASGAEPGTDPVSERDYLAEIPTVLSASRLLQPLSEVPVAMTVIDRATIEASGLRNVTELFRLVPGMYVRPGLGYEGVVPVVSYHGLTNEFARRMQILIDGRSVYMPPFSTVLWDDLPLALDDIERIEVTRGPNAASYGANAFFGTVNIITRAPVEGEGPYLYARSGARGVRDDVARYTGGSDAVDWRVTAGYKADDGFENQYDSQHHAYATARADWALGPRDMLSTQAGYSAGERQLGNPSSSTNRPRTKDVEDDYLQLKWQRADVPGDELSLQYDVERHVNGELEDTLPIDLGNGARAYRIVGDYRASRQNLELQETAAVAPDLRVVGGAGIQVDRVDAPLYFGGGGPLSSNLERLFIHAEWRAAPAWLLQGGGMLERTSVSGTDFAPRIAATWHLDPQQSVRASVSRATRTPSLFEKQGDFEVPLGTLRVPDQLSAGNVRSERLVSSEVGYYGDFAEGLLQVDAKVYRDHATRLIDEFVNPSFPSPVFTATFLGNLDDARVVGAELELHARPWSGTALTLVYADTIISTSAADLFRSMPRNVLAVLVAQEFGGGWSGGVAWYVNSGLQAQQGLAGQSDEPAVGYSHRLDLNLGWRFAAFGHPARIAAGIQNVGSGFVEYRPDTTFTRRAYVEFSGRF